MTETETQTVATVDLKLSADGRKYFDGESWKNAPDFRPVPTPEPPRWIPPDVPARQPPSEVRLAFHAPLADPFSGGREALREVLGEGFEAAAARLTEEARSRARSSDPAKSREWARRHVALRNALEGREPDDARDGREVAEMVVRAWFEVGGGSLAQARMRAEDQRTQILRRADEIDRERATRTIGTGSLGGVEGPTYQDHGLDDRIRLGWVDPLEGARHLAELEAERARLAPLWRRRGFLIKKLEDGRAAKCAAIVEARGRDAVMVGVRESLQVRGEFLQDDPALASLKADLDASAESYSRFKSAPSAEPGPLELRARDARDAALRAYRDGQAESEARSEAAGLERVARVVDAASRGEAWALIDEARRCPTGNLAGLSEEFGAVDLEVALEVDPALTSMLIY